MADEKAAAATGEKKQNVMKEIKVDKLILNCCVGESGDRLTTLL
jgi:ribosomal protein L5